MTCFAHHTSLRGALATKQSILVSIRMGCFASGAHSRDPLARNDGRQNVRSVNRQTGAGDAPIVSIISAWRRSMTDSEIQDFVTRFAAAWAARDGNAFLDLWHPEGTLNTPMVGRTVKGSELNRLLEVQTAAAPDFIWQLLDWASRGDVVIIEWQTTRIVNGARFDWRGVDKFRIRDGRITEEVVYSDTALAPGPPFRRKTRADYEILGAIAFD
jgi:ketosteroid isomerase-like protein